VPVKSLAFSLAPRTILKDSGKYLLHICGVPIYSLCRNDATKGKRKMTTKAWVVMTIPGDEREAATFYVYNRNTLEQVRYDSFDDARNAVRELNAK
jgi:hypothetical protein